MRIAVIPGDGIGAEVVEAVIPLMAILDEIFSMKLQWTVFDWGARKYATENVALPEGAIDMFRREFDHILLGALGDPRMPDDGYAREILLGIRRGLSLAVNHRPLQLEGHCLDIYRENTQGLYVEIGGAIAGLGGAEVAIDECVYTRSVVERFVAYCLDEAAGTGRGVTLVHKANAVPNTGGLWRSVFRKELEKRPSLVGAEAYADSFCYNLIRDPTQFDIVLAPNLLGDIISDVGAALAGGLAMAPSSSICPETGFGLFEPVHGSAPDIAGSGKANPGGMALSLAMLFNHVDRSDVGALLTECVREAAASPTATPDVGGNGTTRTFVESILFRIRQKTS